MKRKAKVKSVVAAAFCLAVPVQGEGWPAAASILRGNCLVCHTAATKLGGLVMESYESLMKGGTHGPAIVQGKSAESRLVLMLEGKIQPQMPQGGKLAAEHIKTLVNWIDAGAPGPAPGEAAPTLAAPGIPDIKPRKAVAPLIASLAFSPDGKTLAAGAHKTVNLLEASTGKPIAQLGGHADVVRAVAFSRDGRRLAAAGGAPAQFGEVLVWDLPSHKLLATLRGHADCLYAVAFSPDGARIATAGYDKLIKLWDAASGKELATLKDHIDAIYALQFSPNGKRLASGAADRTVKLWDAVTGERLFTLGEPLDGVLALAFHPSGKQIAAAGADKFIRVWDLAEKGGTLVHSMAGHEDAIVKLAYSPDGKRLASASADRSLRIWDAETLEGQQSLAQPDWALALTFSPDGSRLAAGRFDGSISIYDTRTFQEIVKPILARKSP